MFVKLPRDFPGPQTPTAALSGISMSTKTPLRDLKDLESLDSIPDVPF